MRSPFSENQLIKADWQLRISLSMAQKTQNWVLILMIYNMSRYKLVYYVKTRIFGFSKIRKSSLVYNFKPCFHIVHVDQFRRLIA